MESASKGTETSDTSASGTSPSSGDAVRVTALIAIAELRHPHLATLRRAANGPGYEVEPFPGLTFIDLAEGVAYDPALGLRVRVRILLDVLSGLAALHHAKKDGKDIGFVHGEVAPHNVIVGRDGIGRLVPLAASHWSEPPVPASESLGYVAPERLLGDVFDQRADVFSIGVLLWEAIAGRRLFENMRMDSIVTQLVGGHITRPLSPPGAPWASALADVAMQALAVDPADRWPQVGVMGAEIETIADGCLASSDDIALLVRQRLGGERASLTPSPSYADEGFDPSSRPPDTQRYSSKPVVSDERRSSLPPPDDLALWQAPPSRQRAPDQAHRDSFRPSVAVAHSSRGGVPTRATIERQSRIIWSAVGVGLALFGLVVHELFERDAPKTADLAPAPTHETEPSTAVQPPRAPAPPAPSALSPNPALHANGVPPIALTGRRSSTGVDAIQRSGRAPGPAQAPAAPRAPGPTTRIAVKQPSPPTLASPPAAPAALAEPGPSAAPVPAPKEDPFGI